MKLTRGLGGDFRQAARHLLATPFFTIFAVLSLAIGVGVTTAGYSVIERMFLRDLGIPEPDRLVFVVTPFDGRMLQGSVSEPDFRDLRAAQTSFGRISASASFRRGVTTSSTTELLATEAVDGAYFATLRVGASLGRVIQASDDAAGARVAVLSHTVWRMRFAANPAIVGQTIRISDHPFEVIGVADASYDGINGTFPGTKLWIPLAAEASLSPPSSFDPPARERRRLVVFGRLSETTALSTASAELSAIGANLDAAFPTRTNVQQRQTERPWRARSAEAINTEDNLLRRFGWTLIALISLVLVVACTNLANLVLARGTTRRQALAVRCALGAPRWRLIREQCVESLLLAVGGAAASYVVFQALRVLLDVEFNLAMPFGGTFSLALQPTANPTAIGIAAASLLISLAVFGLEPAVHLTRALDVRGALETGSGSIGHPRARRQQVLLRWQVAIAAGFFIVATMFVKFTIAEARHDSGVAMDRMAVAVLNFRTQPWDEGRVRRTLDRVMEEARKDPAVESVSTSAGMPFGIPGVRLALSLPDAAIVEGDFHNATGVSATPSIFRTIGVPILRGRGFDDRDRSTAAPVVVLSEFTALRMFGTTDAVGRPLVVRRQASRAQIATVIGIARDTDVGSVLSEPRLLAYMPFAQQYDPLLTVAVRSADGAAALSALREALRRADPDLAVDFAGLGRALSGPFVFLRAVGTATLGLGALTLLLAMVGLFGIQSHIVGHRTREIGVRMSFGATGRQIQWMVLKDGYRPVFEGLVLGLFGGLAGRVYLRAYLDIDVSVVDPWMLFIVPIPLIVAAFCACYVPARRAAGVDPNVALKHT